MTRLAVTVLGSSGSYAAAGNACTGFLLTSTRNRVWLDAGPGTLANLQQTCSLADIDAIVLSHAHPDHWLELPVLANALEWYEQRPPLRVLSNAHTFAEARNLIGAPVATIFDWYVVEAGDQVQIGDQRWSFAETEHYVPTLATRCDTDEGSVVFTADTGPGFDLAGFVAEAGPIDMAIVESTFLSRAGNEGILHLAAPEAGAMAGGAAVASVLLTHQAPQEDREAHLKVVAEIFAGPVELAEVGHVYPAGP